jgi:uncharacterized membrane protein
VFTYFSNLTWPKLAKITWILIGIFIALIFSLCLFKYYTYAYNCLDLAIYNQVFFNSANGHWFNFTIHPNSYLGDHFELIILLLLPLYGLFKSPLALLFIQACFLGFSAIPLYLIAKKHLSPLLSLLVICLYLFNPATLNIALFEFHILALVIFFSLWAFYFYDQNKFWPFVAFCSLSLLIREDVALLIFMFGIIALIDRKKIQWIITPLALATGYFFMALKLSAYFAGAPNYKFLLFYNWLGNSQNEIIINFFLKFPEVLKHIFLSPANLEMVLGLFLVVFFIPLYRPKYLLLAVPNLLEFTLSQNSSAYVMQSHYISLFLPVLLIAGVFSLKTANNNAKIINFRRKYPEITYAFIIGCLLFSLFVLSPLKNLAGVVTRTDYEQVALKNQFAQIIPTGASLLTSYDLLPNLSSRSQLYFFRYAYFNQQQFDLGTYALPENLQYILINFDDFIYLDNSGQLPQYESKYNSGAERFADLLAKDYSLVKIEKNLALWQKNAPKSDLYLYEILDKIPAEIANKKSPATPGFGTASADASLDERDSEIEFLGFNRDEQLTSFYFKALKPMDKNYFLDINNHFYPLGYGLYPTGKWQPDQIIKINLHGLTDFDSFQIASPWGVMRLGLLNSMYLDDNNVKIIGEASLD